LIFQTVAVVRSDAESGIKKYAAVPGPGMGRRPLA
jgi:hypothetical protein